MLLQSRQSWQTVFYVDAARRLASQEDRVAWTVTLSLITTLHDILLDKWLSDSLSPRSCPRSCEVSWNVLLSVVTVSSAVGFLCALVVLQLLRSGGEQVLFQCTMLLPVLRLITGLFCLCLPLEQLHPPRILPWNGRSRYPVPGLRLLHLGRWVVDDLFSLQLLHFDARAASCPPMAFSSSKPDEMREHGRTR